MELGSLWFFLIAVLFIGYFILEGFDFGVGILLPFLGKTDHQREFLLTQLAPIGMGMKSGWLQPVELPLRLSQIGMPHYLVVFICLYCLSL